MAFQQYNIYAGLSPCRVVATANQTATYFNGPLNNGVGATLTFATGVLTIDSVDIVLGDSVCIAGQTNDNENGIYICTQTGAVGIAAVLQRRADMQCIEQIRLGMWTTIGAGTVEAGTVIIVVEPLPARFGIDNLVMTSAIAAGTGTAATKAASDNAQPTVASVNGATTANALAVFADVAGTVKNQTVASTLGFGLTLTTGNFAVSAGTIIASGNISSSAGLILQRAVNGLTALAGGAQAGTALTAQINRVTTVVTAADSVQLPAATAGKVITVINAAAANAMAVFPQTGEIINALAANASISVAANKTITFYCAIAGTWNSQLTA